jgi:hypothetical protein
MPQVQILRIVVASPGDVQAERNALSTVVEELNTGSPRSAACGWNWRGGKREPSPCSIEDSLEDTARVDHYNCRWATPPI